MLSPPRRRSYSRPYTRSQNDRREGCWLTTIRIRGDGLWRPIYSVRPRPEASVSTPVKWRELEGGVKIEDFSIRKRSGACAGDSGIYGNRSGQSEGGSNLKLIFNVD